MTDLNAVGTSSAPQDNDSTQNVGSSEQAVPNPSDIEAAPAAIPQPEDDSQAQSDLQSAAAPQPEADPQPAAVPQPEADPQPAAVPQPEIAPQPATFQPKVAPQQVAEAQPTAAVQAEVAPQQPTVTPQTEAVPQQAFGTMAQQPYQTAPQPYGTASQQTYNPAAQAYPSQGYAPQGYAPQGYYYPNQTVGNQTGAPTAAGGPGGPVGPGMTGYPNYPYGAYPPPQQQEKPKKRRVWPWVLLAIFVAIILGVGGCVSCMAYTILSEIDSYESSYYDDDYYWGYSRDDSYNYNSTTFTYDEILSLGEGLANNIEHGAASGGVYRIGSGLDLEPGEYFFEGDETEEGQYYHFESSGSGDSYVLAEPIVYFGNYYAYLEEGDVIVFIPSDDDHYMMLSESASFNPTAPYRSGLYLVGTDIPAGTYIATCDTEAADNASNEAAVYIMQDLAWNDDSITNTYYVRPGGSHTITLEEGMWVEAYAAILTPVD